jgi:3-hydroxyisobutyrate dehydrogenase-like beta-hydroxyacid dehydrogenase
MKVGFIGLGNIGMPMAKVLLAAGFDLTVYNRSRGKVEEMEALGAKGASSVSEIVETTDILLACLPDVPTSKSFWAATASLPTPAAARYWWTTAP